MNNVFDIKRFGKYLTYDLRNFKNNYLFSLVVVGLAPVIAYLLYVLLSFWIFDFKDAGFVGWKILALCIAVTIVVITAPIKLYGSITEKKAGSNWLMIPASGLEKFLSMVIVTCLVIPVCFVAILLCSDLVMSLISPEGYGRFVLSYLSRDIMPLGELSGININFPAATALSWCESMLIFTLGAICFKRGKAGKTILCTFAAGLVFGCLFSKLIPFGFCSFEEFTTSNLNSRLNTYTSVSYTIIFVLLLSGLYYRIRTIKH